MDRNGQLIILEQAGSTMVASLLAAERIIAATYAHNQNYYQQSAKRTGGSVRHERQPSDRAYRSAAAELAGVMASASSVKQAATRLGLAFRASKGSAGTETTDAADGESTEMAERVRRTRRLVDAYNEMQDRLRAEDGYLVPASAKRGLDQAADGFRSIGIARGRNGGLVLDEDKFAHALRSRFEETRQAVAGPFGLSEWLKRTAEQFDQASPMAMLNARSRGLQAYAAYRPASGLYLQMPISGLLLDAAY